MLQSPDYVASFAVYITLAVIPPSLLSMRHLKIIGLLLSVTLIAGCSALQGGKLLAPESFGLTPVAPGLYIEAGADEATRDELREAMANAENAIRNTYGSVNSRPIINACISEGCYKTFGGQGSTAGGAYVFINRILLSPRGLNWHFLAHEWSHAELLSRLTFITWWRKPVWFDEGLAVVVSEAPEHSESHWQFLTSNNIPRPTREELHAIKSLKQWNDAIHRYGEDKNIERKAKGDPILNPVYTAAGQEIRPWLAKVGSSGLLAFIARLNDGGDFESAYQAANTAVKRDAPQATLAPRRSP